jgi:predicted transcriptional regulator
MIRTTISLDEDTQRRLRRIAADRGISMAAVIREAIDDAVEQHAPKPRSLGVGESGVRDTARVAGEVRPEPRAWR